MRIMPHPLLTVLWLCSLMWIAQPASPLLPYSRLRMVSQSDSGIEYTGYCQPYQISSSLATSSSQCSFTVCPNDVLSVDNCDVSCQATNEGRFTFTGRPVVQLQRSTGASLVGAIKSVSLSLSSSCSSRSSRVSCVSLDNYHVSNAVLSSCQSVSLRQSCGNQSTSTACTSLFRVRLFRPSSTSSSSNSNGGINGAPLSLSNRTTWSLVSSLSTASVATGHCDLLSYPFTLTSSTSSSSSPLQQSSTLILMVVLICVGVFTSCSLYRVYVGRCRASCASLMQNSVQPQGSDATAMGSKSTAWWFFKTNIIKPLLPVALAPTAPPSPAPFDEQQQQQQSPPPAGPPGRTPMVVATAAQPSSSPPMTPPRHQMRAAEAATVPVATLVNPFTIPTTPPAPRVGEHVRPYRSVILHPELGSPAIAMPATPSPWSPIY